MPYRLQLLAALLVSFSIISPQAIADPIDFQSVSVEEAKALARSEGRFVFVDLYAEWCGPCKWMESSVFANDSVGAYMNQHFISLRIDAEKEQEAFISSIDVKAYPTLLVYDPKGRLVYRQEGALDSDNFLELAGSMVNLQAYYDDFQQRPKDLEVISRYVHALKWINPKKARSIALKHISEEKDKRLVDSLNWAMIAAFVPASNRTLFQRILENQELAQTYAGQYRTYINQAMNDYLIDGKARGNDAYLRHFLNYVRKYPQYFDNPDSVAMRGQLVFGDDEQDEKWCQLYIRYMGKYGPKDASGKAQLALTISNKFYQETLLQYSLQLADSSMATERTAEPFLAKSQAYDRLGNFQSAYANLLLAYEFVDEDKREDLEHLRNQLKDKSELAFKDGVNIGNQQLGDDGRFTLGVGGKRLMFGYPLPQSTSHFIINVDGKLASNAPHLPGVTSIKGLQIYSGAGATPQVTTSYEFNGLQVTQELTPVDAAGQVIHSGFAQYYRIRYEFINKGAKSRTIGLGLLIDTMVGDNDHCAISADDMLLTSEYGFRGSSMPSRLSFYRTKLDSADLMGAAILKGLEATPPDKMVVGRWPVLHRVTWKLNPQRVRYGDSGYFLKWENKTLPARTSRKFVTYFGLPDHKKPRLRMIMRNENTPTKNLTVYFNHGSSKLDLNAKVHLADLIYNEDIKIIGVLLKGYTDITGEVDFNFELSKRRIKAVGEIFEAHQIPYVPKPYGMEKATSSPYNNQFGNLEDRKVEVEIYYAPATEGAPLAAAAQASTDSQ